MFSDKKIRKKLDKFIKKRRAARDSVVTDFLDASGLWGDSAFFETLKNGLRLEQRPVAGRDRRFWHMIEFFKAVQHFEGHTAEAGCLFGLSSYLICHYESQARPGYEGATHHMFDSFRGFSPPIDADLAGKGKDNIYIQKAITGPPAHRKSSFLHRTKKTLHEFPRINYYEGLIPESFRDLEKRDYKFVHIDLDLYEPIYHSLNFFYPQMVAGGCIVLDDYGFQDWPGARAATDRWARENGCPVIRLTTGNAVILKPSTKINPQNMTF